MLTDASNALQARIGDEPPPPAPLGALDIASVSPSMARSFVAAAGTVCCVSSPCPSAHCPPSAARVDELSLQLPPAEPEAAAFERIAQLQAESDRLAEALERELDRAEADVLRMRQEFGRRADAALSVVSPAVGEKRSALSSPRRPDGAEPEGSGERQLSVDAWLDTDKSLIFHLPATFRSATVCIQAALGGIVTTSTRERIPEEVF